MGDSRLRRLEINNARVSMAWRAMADKRSLVATCNVLEHALIALKYASSIEDL